MRIKHPHQIVLISLLLLFQGSGLASSPAEDNPLDEYLANLDEMGRTLSRWQGDDVEMKSWFFSAYAMVLLQDGSDDDLKPFPTFNSLVPVLWSDFKNLSPRYLIELAGGALAYDDLMKVDGDRIFSDLRNEEQYILILAGYSYLRMLESTVGDSLFRHIISTSTEQNLAFSYIEESLAFSVEDNYDPQVGVEFRKALASGEWLDVEIKRVKSSHDSIEVEIDYNSSWIFPVDVLQISSAGDSTLHRYNPFTETSLTFSKNGTERIVLDPYHKLAEYYRFNNKWPRIGNNIYLQPFAALPDWENYRVKFNPISWLDWDGEKRYGLRFTSGFGVDLWPAYPSDYRHKMTWEFNVHTRIDEKDHWGGRYTYSHPLDRKERLFTFAQLHTYSDWNGISAGMVKYIGDQSFLINGTRLKYHRIKLALESDSYRDTSLWKKEQRIDVIKAGYSGLSITRFGDRLLVSVQSAIGQTEFGTFSLIKYQADLSGVFWEKVVTGIQTVAGSQSPGTPCPYQFTHDYAWQDNLAAIPNFRGQTKLTHSTNNYMGLGVDGGYWYSGLQMKLFGSSLIFDGEGLPLNKARPHHAFGFGVEHKSFFTLGLYFPIWQSHPREGEEPWAWRYQWRLVWNL